MITYKALQTDRRQFLALTGLTLSEFRRLLTAFPQAYQQLYPANQTAQGQPRQRSVGGGCKGRLEQPEDKLLFLLVYLKTYPLQAVMAELFDLSQPRGELLDSSAVARAVLGLGRPRGPPRAGRNALCPGPRRLRKVPRLIIDATERRRQRPKNPEKQALFYSGERRSIATRTWSSSTPEANGLTTLASTYPGKTHDKKMADAEGSPTRRGPPCTRIPDSRAMSRQ